MLELQKSVEMLRKHAKSNIWLLGDFNFPKFTWPENQPAMSPDCSHKQTYELFHDFIDDFNFTQIVTEPTRYNNILDLFLTTNPILVNHVACLPGLSDHDMVIAECALKPSLQKQKPRKVQLFRKADWPKLKSLMLDFQKQIASTHLNKYVNELWTEFTSALERFTSQCIPTKMIRGKASIPWITQEIRRRIRKRDHIYRNYKKTGDPKKRCLFCSYGNSSSVKSSYPMKLTLKVSLD